MRGGNDKQIASAGCYVAHTALHFRQLHTNMHAQTILFPLLQLSVFVKLACFSWINPGQAMPSQKFTEEKSMGMLSVAELTLSKHLN